MLSHIARVIDMKSTIKIGATLFGVTRHFVIIEFYVVDIIARDNGGYFKLATKIKEEDTTYAEAQHRLAFNDLILTDGELNRENVFTDRSFAMDYALGKLNIEEDSLLRKLDDLHKQKAKLLI